MGTLLAAAALAMLVIYAGIKLLIQVNKEALGTLYRWAAWAFIVAGKLLLIVLAIACILTCLKFGMKMRKGKMKHMRGEYEQMDHKMNGKMMNCEGHGMKGGCMNMKGGCMNMMGSCPMKGNCGMEGSCPMMMGHGGESCCDDKMMMGGGACRADSMKHRK